MKQNVITYQIKINYDFIVNEKVLHFLYAPIIGKNAIYVYKHLVLLHSFQAQLGPMIQLTINQLLEQLEIGYDEFQHNIELLEATNLIVTYKDLNKSDKIVFALQEPLLWNEFNRIDKFMNMLAIRLGEVEFEKLKYLFNGDNSLIGLTNISKTFEQKFGITQTVSINFDILHDFLFKHTNKLISLDQNFKVMIDNAYTKFKLSYEEVCMLLLKTLIKQNNEYCFDEKLFVIALKAHVDLKNVKLLNTNLKINRNNHIFIKDADLSAFQYVINDYKTINCEQYLACIQKHAISEADRILIKTLKTDFHLPEYIINILIDYCIYKNNGRIESLYLHKIALTINRLNLNDVNEIITHLQNANQKNNNNHQYNNANHSKVDW